MRGEHAVCGYVYCTNVYVARGSTHRFCSPQCQRRSLKARQRKTPFERRCKLPSCGKLFRPYHMQVYCSHKCSMRHHYELHRAERIAYQKRYVEAHRDKVNRQSRERRRRAA